MRQLAIAVTVAVVGGSACGTDRPAEKSALDQPHQCDQAAMPVEELLQVRPGFNPAGIVYSATAAVVVDGTLLPSTFMIANDSGPATTTILLDGLAPGDTLTVVAAFAATGGPNVTCVQSFTALGPNSLGCGPIEISYQVALGSCVMVCN
jgi:hypothetical protein